MSIKNIIIFLFVIFACLFIKNIILENNSGISSYIIKKSNKAILGAILPLENSTVFIKLSASINGINELEQEFIWFCSSLNKSDENQSLEWVAPINWIEQNPTNMRKASFSISYSSGTADVSILEFPGDGGGKIKNVNRWREQIGLYPESDTFIDASSIIKSSALGDYELFKIK